MRSLTVVTHDKSVGSEQLLVENLLHIALITLLVGVHENDVKFARQFLDGFLSRAFDKRDSVIELVFVECSSRGCNHLRVELQSDDFSLGCFGCFVPRKRTVTSVAADFEDLPSLAERSAMGGWGEGGEGHDSLYVHTSLGLLMLSQEFHCRALERRGHLISILELITCPFPEFLHIF